MADPFLGEIRMVGFNYAPPGWALCQGQSLPLSQNTALFALFGTYYGGDGVNTFGVPDLQGRLPVGFGAGAGLPVYPIGQKGGNVGAVQSNLNMPLHNHAITGGISGINTDVVVNAHANLEVPTPGCYIAIPTDSGGTAYNLFHSGTNPDGSVAPKVNLAPSTVPTTNTLAISGNGGGQAVSVLNPFIAINFIVAVQGIFPSRQ